MSANCTSTLQLFISSSNHDTLFPEPVAVDASVMEHAVLVIDMSSSLERQPISDPKASTGKITSVASFASS